MKDSGAETVIFDTQELGPSRRKKWAFERANFQFFDIDGKQVAYGKYARPGTCTCMWRHIQY